MIPARRTTTAAVVVLATAGGLLTAVAAPASAAVTCASPVFKRQFFANTSFSGTPKKTDCDSVIDQNWGTGAPATGLPADNFGVRWSVTRDFGSGGPFALTASGLDGIRVYLDGVRKIDLWKNVSSTVTKTVNLTIPQGKHTLRVDYVNWTGSAKVKFTYAPRTSATVDKVKPLAPAGVSWDSSSDAENLPVTSLTWARNKEMDLAGYRVYRRVQGTSTWTRVATTTGTTVRDSTPATGKSYYYEVRAYDKAGNESAGSADQGPVETPDRTAPPAPVLTAKGVEASNDLSWSASADAATYRVFRKSASSTTYTLVADLSATGYKDTSASYGHAYDYKVSAIDAAGNAAASNVVRSARTITPPQNVTATVPDWGVEFTWTEPAGGDTADYEVFRSTASPVARTSENLINCRSRKTSQDAAGNTVRSCTDYDGDRGTTYHYVLIRQNTAGRWSTASAEITATRPGDEKPPAMVTGLTAEPLEYGVKLDWDESTAADLDHYEIYEQPDGQWDDPDYLATVDAGTSEYLVGPERADGESTHYIVVAYDIYGNSLTYQDEVDVADWSAPVAKVAVTELDLTPTAIPAETADCELYSWAASTGAGLLDLDCSDSVATTVAGFHVYRWDRTTAQWVRLNQELLPPTTGRYTDSTAPTGTTHHYVVAEVAADGSEAFTNVDYVVTLPSGA